MFLRRLFLFAAATGATFPAAGAVTAAAPGGVARTLTAATLAADETIRLDGALDEPAWARAAAAGDFRQRDPRPGEVPAQLTEVRVLHDRRTLYVGAVLHDTAPAGIRDNKRHRDADLDTDDSFAVLLDPFADGRAGYIFATNPAGVVRDGLLRGDEPNWSWNGLWDVRTRRTADGWQVEMAIPFQALNFDPARSTWTVNFQRVLRRAGEESLWSGWARTEGFGRPVYAGRLDELRGLSQGVGLQVQPYALARRRSFAGRAAETDADGGLDVTYSLSPNLRAAVTVNTDFADTEVDEREVNLGRYPLFFPEKRGFFLEGSPVFGFPGRDALTPFYSRRIGLRSEGPVPVAWGARLAGQAGEFDVGALQLATRAAHGHDAETFSVARVKRRFGADSYAGFLYTRRAGDTAGARDTVALDGAIKLADRGEGKKTVLTPFWVWTTPDDAAPERGVGDASMAGLEFFNRGKHGQWFTAFNQVGAAYAPALGFAFDSGYRSLYTYAKLEHPNPRRRVREVLQELEFEYRENWHGGLRDGYFWITPLSVDFESGDYVGFGGNAWAEQVDAAFEIHPGVVVPAARYDGGHVKTWFGSSSRRAVSFEGELEYEDFYGGTNREMELSVSARPAPGLEFAATAELNRISLPAGKFSTRVLRARGTYSFTPRHAIHVLVQTDDVSDTLGLQARFRWTLRPGADVFLGYLRDWIETETPGRGRRWTKLGEENVIKGGYTWVF